MGLLKEVLARLSIIWQQQIENRILGTPDERLDKEEDELVGFLEGIDDGDDQGEQV